MTLTERAVQGPFATEQREQEENGMVACKDDEEPNPERMENLSLVQAAAKNDGAPGFNPWPPKKAETLRGKEDRRAFVLESGLHISDEDTMQEGTPDDSGGYVDKGRSAGELAEEAIIRKEFA
ncbi:hypothetical protein CCHR01_19438 [Colletotrichum chrysophilum]|uniref:Uncharacterized protein n=1 Tax=Colletotrichum chrysophilum TaxID=1836956 RepID=A0AAD8ZYG7_9PEZI|nr:hypothetical protein CCHR01_19438 [Colletotrichum chrysophilum]